MAPFFLAKTKNAHQGERFFMALSISLDRL
ncbi:hypothetical protein VDT1_1798 [Vibrio sp. 16]|nr:hypothetical protein VDT1_1798 [Vibrio sp. 16]